MILGCLGMNQITPHACMIPFPPSSPAPPPRFFPLPTPSPQKTNHKQNKDGLPKSRKVKFPKRSKDDQIEKPQYIPEQPPRFVQVPRLMTAHVSDQFTVGQNSQEYRLKYYSLVRSLVRSHRSLVCLLHTAHFAHVFRCAYSFARWFTHLVPSLWETE